MRTYSQWTIAYGPMHKLPKNVCVAREIKYFPLGRIGVATLEDGAVVVITRGWNLRLSDLERNKKYVWIGLTFDLELNRYRDNFELM